MNVLMIGVDETSLGGMLTVAKNYMNNKEFCEKTNLMYIPSTTHGGKLKKLFFSLNAYIKISKTIKKNDIDIVHVHMSHGGSSIREGLIMRKARKLGCKTVAHLHSASFQDWYQNLPTIGKHVVSNMMQYADVIIALGKEWKNVYADVTKHKTRIEVIYNAVPCYSSNQYNPDSKEILFLAHMIKRKGIDDLLQAVSQIRDKIPSDVSFSLYGADRDNNIKEKIEYMKLTDIVHYKGWLTNDQRETCFNKTMLNVLPSYNEGLPMTILETMAYGIPNIATNIAAIPEAITDGEDGFLFEPGDVKRLEALLLGLISNQEKRINISDAAYKTVKNKFGIDIHMQKVLELYDSLLN